MAKKKLYRIQEGRIIAGVCMGIAEYLGLDVTLIRIIFVLLSLPIFAFIGIILYIALWIIAPVKLSQEKVICPFCQKNLQERFVWCPHCGKNLNPVCRQCSAALEPTWDHCPKCGAPAPIEDKPA